MPLWRLHALMSILEAPHTFPASHPLPVWGSKAGKNASSHRMIGRCALQARQEQPLHKERFTARYLDPVDRLAEVVYGVLVVLTFTLAYRGIEARYGAPEGVMTAVQR